MKPLRVIALQMLVFGLAISGQAQKPAEDDKRYVLLATSRTSTMQKELDQAAAQGYRILVGSPTSSEEMALFLERVAEPSAPYKYKLLATTRTSTMQRELNEAAESGFRLLPRTMIAKPQLIGGVEIVMVLEQTPKIETKYDYRLLATTRTSTLQKEVMEAQAAGYVLIGMVSRGEHMVIMEKGVPVK
ncbi:MAG TPA: hypothetical protein VJH03_12640 [Blastocatellia bacterium]|nr:hypothetical protein [Blastocatellia bacterium]